MILLVNSLSSLCMVSMHMHMRQRYPQLNLKTKKMKIFTFAKIADKDARHEIYKEIQNGISRFGTWDQEKSLRESWYGKHSMLLKIKPYDWIVHINLPEYGKCVAVKVISEYDYDQGIQCNWRCVFECVGLSAHHARAKLVAHSEVAVGGKFGLEPAPVGRHLGR